MRRKSRIFYFSGFYGSRSAFIDNEKTRCTPSLNSYIRVIRRKLINYPANDGARSAIAFCRSIFEMLSANTRLSPGNLGFFSDFFQNSNETWPKMNEK